MDPRLRGDDDAPFFARHGMKSSFLGELDPGSSHVPVLAGMKSSFLGELDPGSSHVPVLAGMKSS
jgi:hypothetical protein